MMVQEVIVTCHECTVRIASMTDYVLLTLTKDPNHEAYTWLATHLRECENPECRHRCKGLLDLQPCAKLASMSIEEIEKLFDDTEDHGWIREHLRRCKILECKRTKRCKLQVLAAKVALSLRLPPEQRRSIEAQAAKYDLSLWTPARS